MGTSVTDNALTTEPNTTPGSDQPDHSNRNRLVINLMLVATFVVFLNETIIGVAIPRVMEDLKIEASTAQWLSTAFMLTMAVVIPTTGFLMQRLNTRTVFILAMSLFSLGTAIAVIAPGFEVLLVGRVVQASGTAIMMPLLMTTVMTLVPPHSRGKTMGNISIVMSVAPAVGPAIGGVIVQGAGLALHLHPRAADRAGRAAARRDASEERHRAAGGSARRAVGHPLRIRLRRTDLRSVEPRRGRVRSCAARPVDPADGGRGGSHPVHPAPAGAAAR
jgi:hypothetical protein